MQEKKFNAVCNTMVGGLYILYLALGTVAAIANMSRGQVPHPGNFIIVVSGLICFVTAKATAAKSSGWLYFGTKGMSQAMANVYRIGVWLAFVGFLLTFVK